MTDTDFFDTDPDGKLIYTNRESGYQAPEQVWEFDSRLTPGSRGPAARRTSVTRPRTS